MAGWSVPQISGHSGTSQKHRKAFIEVREYHIKHTRLKMTCEANDKIILQDRYDANIKIERILQFVSLIGTGFIVLTFLIMSSYANSDLKAFASDSLLFGQNEHIPHHFQSNKSIAKKHLNAGKAYYCAGDLLKAQDEYVHAIRIFPKDIKIMSGLVDVLSQRCWMESVYCYKAKQYRDYLEILKERNQEYQQLGTSYKLK